MPSCFFCRNAGIQLWVWEQVVQKKSVTVSGWLRLSPLQPYCIFWGMLFLPLFGCPRTKQVLWDILTLAPTAGLLAAFKDHWDLLINSLILSHLPTCFFPPVAPPPHCSHMLPTAPTSPYGTLFMLFYALNFLRLLLVPPCPHPEMPSHYSWKGRSTGAPCRTICSSPLLSLLDVISHFVNLLCLD